MQRNNQREKPVEMSVKYRFKSSIEFSTVLFSGNYISVGDLRYEITKQKRLAPNADYELQIMNADTKHVYEFDQTLIPANTDLIVSRIPVVLKKEEPKRSEMEINSSLSSSPSLLPLPTPSQFSYATENTYYNQNNSEQVNNDYANYFYGSSINYGSNVYDYDHGYENNYETFNEGQPTEEYGYGYHDYEYGSPENSNGDTTQEPNPNLQYVPMTTNSNKSQRFAPYSYTRRTAKYEIPYPGTATETADLKAESGNEIEQIDIHGTTPPTTTSTGHLNKKDCFSRFEKPVPDGYRCFKCSQKGHWIKHCPLLKAPENFMIKKSTGIPRSQMVIVSDPIEGAFITPDGRYAVPVTHLEATQRKRQ